MPSMKYWLCGFISIGLWAAEPDGEAAKKPAEAQPYLRFEEKPKGAALEVGVIRMQHKETGALVDLVGAVHIGDAAYYQQLNKEFKTYEAVLYEMVKPAKLDPAQFKNRPSSSVSMMQIFMQKQLDLAYQLDEVDYTAKNFVHADMTVKQFRKRQEARGESMFKLMFKMMKEDMARRANKKKGADISSAELLRALLNPNRSVELKYLLARQFNEMERLTAGLNDEKGSVILTDRNKVALKVLARELAAGKKKLAIFYGAAHLPDLEERMIEKMGFERKATRWVTAWNLPERVELKKPIAPKSSRSPSSAKQ